VKPTVQNTPMQSPLMPPPEDIEVAFVKATPMRLKGVNLLIGSDDIRYAYPPSRDGVVLEDCDYYSSKVERTHLESQQVIPAGAHYCLVDVERHAYGRKLTGIPNNVAGGKQVVMETIDPRDPDKRLQFRYWSTNEEARTSFKKITNQMVILAIAATGL
jgi:hypothetical protein